MINRILFIKGIILPFGIRESLLAISYLYVGYYFVRNIDINNRISKLLFIISLILFIYVIFRWDISASYYNSNIGNLVEAYILGITGSFLLIYIVLNTGIKDNWLLQLLGQNSLIIYGTHYYFFEVWLILYRSTLLGEQYNIAWKIVIDFLGVAFIVFLCIVVIMMIRKYEESYVKKLFEKS